MKGTGLLIPFGPQISFAGRQVESTLLAMWHEIDDWSPIARDDDLAALLNFSRQLSQPVLCLADRYGFHILGVATCGYIAKQVC